jgi:hypothetical protein
MAGYTITFDDYEFKPVPKITIDVEHKYTEAGGYLYTEDIVTLEGYITGDCPLATGSGILEKINYVDSDLTKSFTFKSNGFNIYDDRQASVKSFNIDAPANDSQSRFFTYTAVFSIIDYLEDYRSLTEEETDATKYPIVSSVTDNYTLEPSDQKHIDMKGEVIPLLKLTRNIGAVGVEDGGSKPAIWKAKKWIKDRQKLSAIKNMTNLKDWYFYNHERKVDEDVVQGGLNIVDSFLVSSQDIGTSIHNYTIDFSQDVESDLQVVNIKGTIQGCEPAEDNDGIGDIYYKSFDEDSTEYYKNHIRPTVSGHPYPEQKSKVFAYDNAYTMYIGLASTGIFWLVHEEKDKIDEYFDNVSNDALQYLPISINEGFNIRTASISYEYSYNNRMDTLLPGALVENFTITNSSGVPNKKYKHTIIGRTAGPLLICEETSSGVSTKTLSYEAIFPPYTGLSGYSYSQKIKSEVYGVLTYPLGNMLGNNNNQKKGYIESYDAQHNLGENRVSATLKFVYNHRCY